MAVQGLLGPGQVRGVAISGDGLKPAAVMSARICIAALRCDTSAHRSTASARGRNVVSTYRLGEHDAVQIAAVSRPEHQVPAGVHRIEGRIGLVGPAHLPSPAISRSCRAASASCCSQDPAASTNRSASSAWAAACCS